MRVLNVVRGPSRPRSREKTRTRVPRRGVPASAHAAHDDLAPAAAATLRVRLRGRARRRAFVRSVERGDITGRKITLGLRLLRRR